MRAYSTTLLPSAPLIRLAAPVDLAEIERIERAAFATPWSAPLLRAAVRNDEYDVRILSDGSASVLGFYIAHRTIDRSNLDNLAVDAPVRDRGHGHLLLDDWLARSARRSLRTLTLQVNIANLAAQRLYRRYSFRSVRRLAQYYPNGEDAFEMVAQLRTAGLGRPR